jgi:hypothetical protein
MSSHDPADDRIVQEQMIQDGLEEHDVEPEEAEHVASTTVEDAEARAREADEEVEVEP